MSTSLYDFLMLLSSFNLIYAYFLSIDSIFNLINLFSQELKQLQQLG